MRTPGGDLKPGAATVNLAGKEKAGYDTRETAMGPGQNRRHANHVPAW